MLKAPNLKFVCVTYYCRSSSLYVYNLWCTYSKFWIISTSWPYCYTLTVTKGSTEIDFFFKPILILRRNSSLRQSSQSYFQESDMCQALLVSTVSQWWGNQEVWISCLKKTNVLIQANKQKQCQKLLIIINNHRHFLANGSSLGKCPAVGSMGFGFLSSSSS